MAGRLVPGERHPSEAALPLIRWSLLGDADGCFRSVDFLVTSRFTPTVSEVRASPFPGGLWRAGLRRDGGPCLPATPPGKDISCCVIVLLADFTFRATNTNQNQVSIICPTP